jgi:hypothetical protein
VRGVGLIAGALLTMSGFDVALAGAVIATGIGLPRRRLSVESAAAGTLLVCDAWSEEGRPTARRWRSMLLTFPQRRSPRCRSW